MRFTKTVVALLKHRVTWRFLLVLAGALGYSYINEDISKLEDLVCTLLTCSD